MNTLYERIARTDDGAKRLAVARLKREVLRALHTALKASGLNQKELASRLKVRKSAVSQALRGEGNLRVQTVAEYLHALGYELDVRLVEAGEPRKAALEDREVAPAFPVTPRSAEQSITAPEQITVHSAGSFDLLVGMNLQWNANLSTLRFEGSAHAVPKSPSLTTAANVLKIKEPPLRTVPES